MVSKIWVWDPGSEIWDPEKTYSGSWIWIRHRGLNQEQKIIWKHHGYPSLTAAELQLLAEKSVERQLLGCCRHTRHFD
jgi:hypothetical protein